MGGGEGGGGEGGGEGGGGEGAANATEATVGASSTLATTTPRAAERAVGAVALRVSAACPAVVVSGMMMRTSTPKLPV